VISPSKSNDPYITTLAALYATNEILLAAYDGGVEINKDFKQFRRSSDELDAYYSFLEEIWMRMLEKCPDFDSILNGRKKPGDIRKRLDANDR
jgi:DNA sulfur modification protein DndB